MPLESIAQSARNGQRALFCGAGVSMLAPSRSPSWWEIYAAAAWALDERLKQGFPEITFDHKIDDILAPLQTQQLADMIVSHFAGRGFVEILQVVDVADPNDNHMLIAALAASAGLPAVITTNFDTLLERAAVLGGRSFRVTAPELAPVDGGDTRVPLIKLHGSAVDARLLIETSSDKARRIDPRLSASWREAIVGRICWCWVIPGPI